jgi:spore coat protein A
VTDKNNESRKHVSRRKFLIATGVAELSAIAGCSTGDSTGPERGTESKTWTETETTTQGTPINHSSPALEKWVDEVPRPGVVEPTGTKDGQPYYEIEIKEIEQKIHRDLPATTLYGYDGQYPGPTIEAEQDEPIYVRWQNKLPDEHFLPVDTTVHSDIIPYDKEGVRAVTHLHGGNTESASDGRPKAWFTPDFEETGPDFKKKDYYYSNDQPPATLWYHDHALGITRLNSYAGLAGFYLIRNEHERDLGLPEGKYEIPLTLQDRSFNEDGSLFYPTTAPDEEGNSYPEPSIVPQFYGDTPVVNGKAWPRLSVEPRKYRFRILNGSNSRFYNLKLFEHNETSGEASKEGPPFLQIGNDGGLLSEPVKVSDRLEIGSSQRADVVVDFTDYAGRTLLLHNNAPAKYRGMAGIGEGGYEPLPEIMLIDVSDSKNKRDSSQVQDELTQVPNIPADSVDNTRYVTLAPQSDEYGRKRYLLGTEEKPTGHKLTDPVTEKPTVGDTEIWSIANLTGMSHPVHLHLVHFQVLGRQSSGDYEPATDDIEPDVLEAPKTYELGWNDVVTVDPGEVVHVIAHFGEYKGLFSDRTGDYMWHCHMMEHEEYDMMRTFRVVSESEDRE